MNIENTLADRAKNYGTFAEQAEISQRIKESIQDAPKYGLLSDDKKQALDMIALKIGRILNGNPEHHDSWHDIVGYAKLVADTLKPEVLPIIANQPPYQRNK